MKFQRSVFSALLFLALLASLAANTSAESRTIVVSQDGKGDFATVQSAVDSVPDNSADRTIIEIRPGTYKERILITKNKRNITFRGADAKTTALTNDWNAKHIDAGKEVGTSGSYSTKIEGDGFTAENITFENTAGDTGQAVALMATGDRQAFLNCRMIGWQDTLYVHSGRAYFGNCYVEGRVDFIFGKGSVVFDRCTIHSKNGGYIAAANTPPDRRFGFVFLDCTLTGEGEKPAFLARPWQWDRGSSSSVTFVRCKMGPHINPEGWNPWHLKDKQNLEPEKVTRFAEFGSMDASGKPLDVSKRVAWSKQLTAEDAAEYAVENILRGDDDWKPKE